MVGRTVAREQTPMIQALALILLCQLAGEVAARGTGLPVPGPVIGALLLFGWLAWRKGVSDGLGTAADTLLSNLSLLFVPAGVGVMMQFARIGEAWPAILAALIISTFLTVVVTAKVFCLVAGNRPTGGDAGESRP